ncbi:hypothetical protein D3C77_509750 [compost metagenome]
MLALEALGQLLGQFARGGGLHLGHDGGQGARAHGRGDRQTHAVVQSGEDGRRLLGPHGRIDGDQAVVLGLFLLVDLTDQGGDLALERLERLQLGVQLLLGGDHQRQGGGEIGVARVQGVAALGQGLDDPQFGRRDARLLGQLLGRQGADGRGGLGLGLGPLAFRGHGFLGPGGRALEQFRRHARGAHGHDAADGDGDQGQKAGQLAHRSNSEKAA